MFFSNLNTTWCGQVDQRNFIPSLSEKLAWKSPLTEPAPFFRGHLIDGLLKFTLSLTKVQLLYSNPLISRTRFSYTLSTKTINNNTFGWFRAFAYRTTLMDLPSSYLKHSTVYCSGWFLAHFGLWMKVRWLFELSKIVKDC